MGMIDVYQPLNATNGPHPFLRWSSADTFRLVWGIFLYAEKDDEANQVKARRSMIPMLCKECDNLSGFWALIIVQ